MDYRHELKFEVSDIELEILRHRLHVLMRPDMNQTDGFYTITSLYFDDIYDSCLADNEAGVDDRRKFRLRIYNNRLNMIKLEKKSKFRDMTQKESVVISEKDCRIYMNGKNPEYTDKFSHVEKELYCEMQMHGMTPKSIVEYERTAFVDPKGNVRVTFDRNIKGSRKVTTFLDETVWGTPLLPAGKHILEVKYDEFLPEYLEQVMELGNLQRTSFSKYYYSRING